MSDRLVFEKIGEIDQIRNDPPQVESVTTISLSATVRLTPAMLITHVIPSTHTTFCLTMPPSAR